MSDNYNQIPLSVNTRQQHHQPPQLQQQHQSQINNISNLANYINTGKPILIHSPANALSTNNGAVPKHTQLYSNSKYLLNNSISTINNTNENLNTINSGLSSSSNNSSNVTNSTSNNNTPTSNNNITKIISRANDLDLEYLDLNELNYIINNDENESFNTLNDTSADESPKVRRSVLIDPLTTSNNVNKPPQPQHHHHTHHHLQQQVAQSQQHQHQHHHRYSRYESLLLKELSQLGIKREKLEKGLSATGYQNSVDVINWLMKHSKDPVLANDSITSSRDYMLVMCPIGRLASQIGTFFQQSKVKCGTNEAHFHHVLPYMKLSPFFKVILTQCIAKSLYKGHVDQLK